MPTKRCECGARYRFPESAVGKRARCKKCGVIFALTPEEDEGPIPLADDGQAEVASVASEDSQPVSAAYLPTAESPGRLGPVVIEESSAPVSYGRALVSTVLFPTSGNNLAMFIFVSGLLFVAGALNALPLALIPLGMIGQAVILGWYSAFRFGVIADAAAGEKDLPALTLTAGLFEEIIVPLFKWLGSWAIVLLPAFAYLVVTFVLAGPTRAAPAAPPIGGIGRILQWAWATPEMIPFTALACAGVFMWPMIVLCVALGGFATLGRVDLIIVTVFRTFPVYLLTVGIVFGTDLLNGLLTTLVARGEHVPGGFFVLTLVTAAIGVYFEIVAMRAIGLYYHHFKHRFAWSWG